MGLFGFILKAHRVENSYILITVILDRLIFFPPLVFRDRVSLYSPGCSGTHFVDQAGIELRNLPASAGIKGVHHHTRLRSTNFKLRRYK